LGDTKTLREALKLEAANIAVRCSPGSGKDSQDVLEVSAHPHLGMKRQLAAYVLVLWEHPPLL
jgi:hypothetical protein